MHQKLLNSLLEKTFYKNWKVNNDSNSSCPSIEFIVNGKCNQKCKYCYISNFGDKLFPVGSEDNKKIIDNTILLMKWLKKNNFKPKIEVFSAEIFSQKIGFQLLDLINELGWEGMSVVIPSNFNFLFSDKKILKVYDLKKKFSDSKQNLHLSCSIDGKFVDSNRPLISSKIRDDNYYEKMFSTYEVLRHGFHPMVYSEGIEHWIKNFLWFQDNFVKYNIPYHRLYMLEVRNKEWNEEQCIQFGKFMEFLVEWLRDFINDDDKLIKVLLRADESFNLLSSPIIHIPRGMPCSIQSTFMVRLGDLAVVPCHRTMYPQFKLAEMEVCDNEIIGTKVINYPLYLATKFALTTNFPYCVNCAIKYFCLGGCYGAQYEVTGDLFTPIPTMCRMEHAKIFSYFKTLKYKTNIWSKLKSKLMDEKISALHNLEKQGMI
jgi:radical SAM protein with 4Fe4S-binding SPASM domain